jgi:hypothetical protein
VCGRLSMPQVWCRPRSPGCRPLSVASRRPGRRPTDQAVLACFRPVAGETPLIEKLPVKSIRTVPNSSRSSSGAK